MASKSSIAIRMNAAMESAIESIRAIWGENFELPRNYRDPDVLKALQWESIASYLDCKAQGVNIQVDVDLDALPVETTVSVPVLEAKPARKPARTNGNSKRR